LSYLEKSQPKGNSSETSDRQVRCLQGSFILTKASPNLQKHIQETVPEGYQKCMIGMKRNLEQTLEIAETAADPKTKLQVPRCGVLIDSKN